MKPRNLIAAALAIVGLSHPAPAAPTNPAAVAAKAAAPQPGQKQSVSFPMMRYTAGIYGKAGMSPKDWGMSPACKRIVTKHAHAQHIGFRRWHT